MNANEAKRQHPESSEPGLAHDDKKAHTKPGRKFVNTEPKSKRTAQNRAAQRAYRERKEKKMRDLEEKVADLEDKNIKAVTEQDMLKAQIDMLKRELARHRGHSDFSDLSLPTTVGQLSKKEPELKLESPSTSHSNVSAEFPWSSKSMQNFESNDSNQHLPDLVSGSSSSTSPNDNNIVSPGSQTSGTVPTNSSVQLNLSPSNQFNISPDYDEQLDPFCVKLGEACGTKQRPVPKYRRSLGPIPPVKEEDIHQLPQETEHQTLFTPADHATDPFFNDTTEYNFGFPLNDNQNDLLSFYNDNNFDVSLAFGNPTNELTDRTEKPDAMAGLVSEESAYDPFATVNTDFNFNEFVKSSLPSDISSRANSEAGVHRSASSVTSYNTNSPAIREEPSKEEVVPAAESTMKCAEIWDRITSHPRYTELDIDGLCNELKTKAKCSEKGVVLDSKDVNKLIEKSVLNEPSYLS